MEPLPKALCYQFIKRIAQGASASVYLAQDFVGKARAVKVFDRTSSSNSEHREVATRDFLRELETLSSLSHPNLAALIDFGHTLDSNADFLVFEYLEGRDFITASRDASLHDFYSLIIQVCRALDYLHGRGISHGDLKPPNVLILSANGQDVHPPKAKLIDLAYAGSHLSHEVRVPKGTPHYMAPEIIVGEHPTPASDLYSFGAVLYESLVGTPPFHESDVGMVLQRHLLEGSPRVQASSLVELHPIIHQLLSKTPDKRPSSAAEVVRLINAVSPIGRFDLQTSETWNDVAKSSPLVGREHLLDEASRLLSQYLRNDELSEPFCLVLLGPKGSGKTRLVREIAVQARLRHCRPILLTPGSVKTDSDSLDTMFDAVGAQNPSAPCLVVYDGVRSDTVDDATTVLTTLPRGKRLSVLITIDTSGVPTSFASRIEALLGTSYVHIHAQLDSMSHSDVASVISFVSRSTHVEPSVTAAFHAHSGGNPLILADMLAANLNRTIFVNLGGTLTFYQQTTVPNQPPSTLSHAEALLKALSRSDYSVVHVIAAAPEPLTLQDTAALTRIDPDALATACIDLVSRGILRMIDEKQDPRYTVSMTALKDIALGQLTKDQKAHLHEHIARWYLKFPDRNHAVANAALSFVASGRRTEALEYCTEAGRRAAQAQDHRSAAGFFQMALDHIDNDEIARAMLTLDLVDALIHLGQLNVALDLLNALRSDAGLPDYLRARIHLARADCIRYTGDVHLHERTARTALMLAKRARQKSLILKAMVELGTAHCLSGQRSEGKRILHRAALSARRVGQTPLAALATHVIAFSYWKAGDSRGALRFERRVQRLTKSGDDFRAACHSLLNIGVLQSDLGRYRAARRSHKTAVDLAHTFDAQGLVSTAANNIGETYRSQGRWPHALKHFTSARDRSRTSGSNYLNLTAETNAAQVFARVGQYTEALHYLKHRMKKSRPLGHVQATHLLLLGWAILLSALGRYAAASRLSTFACSFAERSELWGSVLEMKVLMARVLACMGKGEDARSVMAEAIGTYEGKSPFDVTLTARLAQAQIEQELRAPSTTVEGVLASIIQIARRKKMRWHLAGALMIRGAGLTSANRGEEAEPALREAVMIARTICDRTLDWQANALLGRAYEQRLQYERALACYRVAALTIHELAMNIVEERYRRSFLDQPKVKEALEHYERLRLEVGKQARYDIAAMSRSEKISRKMLSALSAIGQKLTSILDLDELLGTLLDLSIENVRAERGIVFLRDEISGEMRVECARGMGKENLEEVASFSRSVVKRVAEGETLLTVDVGKDAGLSAYESLALYEIKSILCVPMRARGKVIGVIYLDTRRAAQLFTDKERAFIDSFAGQAAIAVENARLFGSINTENMRLRSVVEGRCRFENLVGTSPVMGKLVATISSVLGSDCNVLILGESGTGKDLVAKAIHYNGPRRKKQFLAVDCGALPETLLEAELFGHARGAFTGAERDRIGLIQEADGGTLFLDEIANTTLALQARLLRVLQEHEVRRLGENTTRQVDVRILAATNSDLRGLIAQGRFRQDLYYRLNVVTIEVPPLRDRREDIPLLVDHLLRERGRQGRPIKPFGRGILAALSRHDWPGNVRELENVVERLIILSPGNVVTEADLPDGIRLGVQASGPGANGDGNGHKTGEQLMIEDALRRCRGDKAKAARFIGWNRQKLYRRMRLFGIPADYGQTV